MASGRITHRSHVKTGLVALAILVATALPGGSTLAARPNELTADIGGGVVQPLRFTSTSVRTCEEQMVEIRRGKRIYPTCEIV